MKRLLSAVILFLVLFQYLPVNGQLITTFAGNGSAGYVGDNGVAMNAGLNSPNAVAIDASGNILIADAQNNCVRKVTPCGIITTIAGTGVAGAIDNVSATTAQLNHPTGIAIDNAGNIYIADQGNNCIRKILTGSNVITTYAGQIGAPGGFNGDGQSIFSTLDSFNSPTAIAIDNSNNIYIADKGNQRIRMISSTNNHIITVAGNGSLGSNGDGAAATAAQLKNPSGIAVAPTGDSFYVADRDNNKIRKVNRLTGIISTVAGSGILGYLGNGSIAASTATRLNAPEGVALDVAGNIYVADKGNNRVRKITVSTGIITTISGSSTAGFNGDRIAATGAQLFSPTGLAVSGEGNIFIADNGNNRVRFIFADRGPSFAQHNKNDSLCMNVVTPVNNLLTVVDSDAGQILIWSVASAPLHGSCVITYRDTTSGCTVTPVGINYNPVRGFYGNDTIKVYVTDGTYSDSTFIYFTIKPLPNPGVVTGAYFVCPFTTGNDTLTASMANGSWSISNSALATITPVAGTLKVSVHATGAAFGLDTVTYTDTLQGCTATATRVVAIAPFAGNITGPTQICTGATITLKESVLGGLWSATNSRATIVTTGGTVTGVSAGIDTIVYSVAACGATITDTQIIYVGNGAASAGAISGGGVSLCSGAPAFLSSSSTGGVWSQSNSTLGTLTIAGAFEKFTASSGVGVDTIYYTKTNTTVIGTTTVNCTSIADTQIYVGGSAGTITGTTFTVCRGSSITLSETSAGGTWSASNANATINSSGIVTGYFAGTDTITYSIGVGTCGGGIATRVITIGDTLGRGAIMGADSVCQSGTTTLTANVANGLWSSGNSDATVSKISLTQGVVAGLTAGLDTITYSVSSGSCGTSSTFTINVKPLPVIAPLTGNNYVCFNNTATLVATTTGGNSYTWSSSNLNASVNSSTGVVTGNAVGSATISFTSTNFCGNSIATKSISIDTLPNRGIITGFDTVCQGASLTLAESVSGGFWSASNINLVNLGSGAYLGHSAGIDTIQYKLTNHCGSDTAFYPVTVKPLPNHGAITGSSTVCLGGTTTLANTTASPVGIWSSKYTGIALVSTGGVVTGMSLGIIPDTIKYSVSNWCGVDSTIFSITVITLPSAGVISPATGVSVCVGQVDTLSESVSGGVWTKSNANISLTNITGAIDSAKIVGISAGMDALTYTVTNSCGSHFVTKTITVNPLPFHGTVVGPSAVCLGTSITLTDPNSIPSTGTWSSYHNNMATVGSGTGIVHGQITTGIDTIKYKVSNACGVDSVLKYITVSKIPDTGTITGPLFVCVGATASLVESTSGGVWVKTNTHANLSTSGVVTGITAGIDTIRYVVSNFCGSDTATHAMSVIPLPYHGVITSSSLAGSGVNCIGTRDTLRDTTFIGTTYTWTRLHAAFDTLISISNTPLSQVIDSGIAPGIDTITFKVSNECGSDSIYKIVTVTAIPYAGTITGGYSVCVHDSMKLKDVVTGGIWKTNSHAVLHVRGDSAFVIGITAGVDTITYTYTNACGSARDTQKVTINPLPDAGVISFSGSFLCQNQSLTLSETVTGGTWGVTNNFARIFSNGVIFGDSVGIDSITYTDSNMCGKAIKYHEILINPAPYPGKITGTNKVCLGTTVTLTDTVTGGVWSSYNSHANINVLGIVKGLTLGVDTIEYKYSNMCGSDSTIKVITVNPLPNAPNIATFPQPTNGKFCLNTMYQNFGADTAQAAGQSLLWTATNAELYATGKDRQSCLVNFIYPGTAIVKLSLILNSTTCQGSDSVIIQVDSNNISQNVSVINVGKHLLCLDNTPSLYQWGYDDKKNLDSTIIPGAINQDLYSDSLDFVNKYYWVITKWGNCIQKTYYKVPMGVNELIDGEVLDVDIFPNPATKEINFVVTGNFAGDIISVKLFDLFGREVQSEVLVDGKGTANINNLPNGLFMAEIFRNNVRAVTKKFIKN